MVLRDDECELFKLLHTLHELRKSWSEAVGWARSRLVPKENFEHELPRFFVT